MSSQGDLQSAPSPVEQPHSDREIVTRQRYRVGDVLPARLFAADLMWLFDIKAARFYELKQAGRFDRFQLKPTVGRVAWSGAKVAAYFAAVEKAS